MPKKILLVDDDTTVHLLVVPNLCKVGYTVVSAKDGEQGLLTALRERPDLIILDVIMPGIKGQELCKKIKTHPELKDIPVIFFTVQNSEEDIKAGFESGAMAHLTKPVHLPDLLKTISDIIGK